MSLVLVIGVSLLMPKMLLAAEPAKAFEATTLKDVMLALYGSEESTEIKNHRIKTPRHIRLQLPIKLVSGNGVYISFFSDIKNITSIAFIVPNNSTPLATYFSIGKNFTGELHTGINVCVSSKVVVVVEAGGKRYISNFAGNYVAVTKVGCRDEVKEKYMHSRKLQNKPSMSGRIKSIYVNNNTKKIYVSELVVSLIQPIGDDNYIQNMVIIRDDKVALTAYWGPTAPTSLGIQTYFEVASSKRGEIMKMTWLDNKGKGGNAVRRIR